MTTFTQFDAFLNVFILNKEMKPGLFLLSMQIAVDIVILFTSLPPKEIEIPQAQINQIKQAIFAVGTHY